VQHTADITRNRNGFEGLRDPAARSQFYAEANRLIAGLDLSVVACAILKEEHLARHGPLAIDPYMLSLGVLVERFCFTIARDEPPGAIVVGRRGRQLHRELLVAWQSLRLNGTRYVSPGTIARRIASLELRGKCAQAAGLQPADLVVSPTARAVIGRDAKDDYAIIRSKMRRSPAGRVEGAGLVVLPKRRGRGPLRSSRPRPLSVNESERRVNGRGSGRLSRDEPKPHPAIQVRGFSARPAPPHVALPAAFPYYGRQAGSRTSPVFGTTASPVPSALTM
jgi:hypothetical protein